MKRVNFKNGLFALVAAMISVTSLNAKENVSVTPSSTDNGDGKKLTGPQQVMALGNCQPGKTQTELKLNNVRTRILTCGDMWWDLNSNPKYEVPKGSGSYASFAGSLWFGGYVSGQLRTSAMTYRQDGIDFWPGPLNPTSATTDEATCLAYDKHWRFVRADVDEFYNKYSLPLTDTLPTTVPDPSYSVPAWIKDYPGNAPSLNDPYQYLAPFIDNGDDDYNWQDGDYPAYNVSGAVIPQGSCKQLLFGDETLFWVFNDMGNAHGQTGTTTPIGVEIRAQAFEFSTADVLNDMTFYNFEIINRSTNLLDSTYFAVWVDADLGFYNDDYVGCDVVRGLGYIYNGDNYDEDGQGAIGYKGKLPALGCDFFQGPNADLNDNIDNDRDGCIDCTYKINPLTGLVNKSDSIIDSILPEHISMSKFVPYNNDGNAVTGNPSPGGNGLDFYRYMSGKWRNGTAIRYDPATKGTGTSGPSCSYVYPGTSDPLGYGVGGGPGNPMPMPKWTEVTVANNPPADRRFLQSAGKFTLQPGAINNITFGMPFVRTNSAQNEAALPLLYVADDKAQSLFDNCFKVLDGPDAPDLTIQELENQLIVYLSNDPTSNNYELDRYADIDATITPILGDTTDKTYRFEGYMVFQLKDETVSAADLYDEDKARLVFQSDKKNEAAQLINYNIDPTLGNVPQLMTPSAENKGVKNSFTLTEDLFAEGNKTLVNHKTYYYMSVAYAYNNYLPYKQDVAPSTDTAGNEVHLASGDYMGQKKPFLQGRKNLKIYSAVPHNIAPEAGGTVLNTAYGFGPKVKRLEGQGNGGNALDLTESTINSILASTDSRLEVLEYENNRAPIQVKVIDPLRVLSGDFVVKVKKATEKPTGGYDLTMGEKTDLDSGKVKMSYRYQVEGTYVNAAGATVSKIWDGDESIQLGQELILIGDDGEPVGISVAVSQVKDPNCNIYTDKNPNNLQPSIGSAETDELLESSLTFSTSGAKWLTAVSDIDVDSERNWIRAGTSTNGPGSAFNDAYVIDDEGKSVFDDPNQVYENIIGGTWAPYRLCAQPNLGVASTASPAGLAYAPAFGFYSGSLLQWKRLNNYEMDNRTLASVDIVFTSDKSKWTRCVVLEMGYYGFEAGKNIGNQRKFLPRKSHSVSINGDTTSTGGGKDKSDYISATGMGWFPGYAINVETGERLNMAFGENSSDAANNGTDMFWNPTGNTAKFGGMHYIYVFGHNSDGTFSGEPIDVPRYDAGAALFQMLNKTVTVNNGSASSGYGQPGIVEAFKDAMWVNLPLIASGYTDKFPAKAHPSIPCDTKVRIRVKKPLRYGLSGNWAPSYSVRESGTSAGTFVPGTTFLTSLNPANLTVDTVQVAKNNNFPMYSFSTAGLSAKTGETDIAKDALKLVSVVPNPYYGHSQYEKTRIDNYIKIVNLPVKCTVKIYTVNGTLLRTINKDTDATTDITWDLKNDKNILVTSGLYIIHVDAGDLGEKVVKWFCVMRPIDLQSY